MDFDDIGGRCQFENCNQLDYLPFECNLCNKVFCLNHKSYDQHMCMEFNKKKIIKTKKTKNNINRCHFCNKKELFDFKCSKCNKVICIKHRHLESHDCEYLKKKSEKVLKKEINENCCIIA